MGPDYALCGYYDRQCSASGGKCNYTCKTAPMICSSAHSIPLFFGVTTSKLNCIRGCLINEDRKARANPDNLLDSDGCQGDKCLKDNVIDDYHITCFTKCNVWTFRYRGVAPFGNE